VSDKNLSVPVGPVTPLSAVGSRNSHTQTQLHQRIALVSEQPTRKKKQHILPFIHGILWSPQVAHTRKSNVFCLEGARYCTRGRFSYTIRYPDAHAVLAFYQVFRPLWPFFAASGITYYLVSMGQDLGVRCASFHLSKITASSHPSYSHLFFFLFNIAIVILAEGFRTDPRNPYAAQIAKEEHAQH
jgi:F-type H+-transporting ATPase subunit j